jgi:hypothetical protein
MWLVIAVVVIAVDVDVDVVWSRKGIFQAPLLMIILYNQFQALEINVLDLPYEHCKLSIKVFYRVV